MVQLQGGVFFIIFLGVLVTVHELGHFLVAKWAGVKVLKFSIGFGPKIFGFTRGETEYQVAWIPLGGYVRMAGELPGDAVDEADEKRSFLAAAWWKRALIVLAGPVFNLVFPVVAFFFVLLGTHQAAAARVGAVQPGSAAAVAGFRPGDVVTEVDGHPVLAFEDISPALRDAYGRQVLVKVRRGEQVVPLEVTPRLLEESNGVTVTKRGLLGIALTAPEPLIAVEPGSPAAAAGLQTFDRIVGVAGHPVRYEPDIGPALAGAKGPVEVLAVRLDAVDAGGLPLTSPRLVKATLTPQPGEGLAALGLAPGDLRVWNVVPGSPAAGLGLARGDRLTAVDGQPVHDASSVQNAIELARHRAVTLAWASPDGQAHEGTFGPLVPTGKERYCVGSVDFGLRLRFRALPVSLARPPMVSVTLGPLDAFKASLQQVPGAIAMIAGIIGQLFSGEVPLESMGGPMSIFEVAATASGARDFLQRMGMVSVNLGLVNLLPIPILDGFGLLTALWEGVRRRPVPLRVREIANLVGLVMLAMLMVLVFRNDISRLLYC